MDRKILRKMFHDVAAFIVLGALGVSIKTCQGQKAEPALVQRLKILGTTLPLHLWSLRTTFRTLLPWAHQLHPTLLEVSLTKYLEVHATCWFTWLSSESQSCQRRFLFHPGSKSMVSVMSFGAGHNVAIYRLIPTIHHHQKMSKDMAICRLEIHGRKMKCPLKMDPFMGGVNLLGG